MSNSLQPHRLQHTRLPRPSLSPRVYSNFCPLSWWCHPTISSYIYKGLILINLEWNLFTYMAFPQSPAWTQSWLLLTQVLLVFFSSIKQWYMSMWEQIPFLNDNVLFKIVSIYPLEQATKSRDAKLLEVKPRSLEFWRASQWSWAIARLKNQ